MDLLKRQDAARMINVSYPTLKQWIYQGRIRSVKTPGGHHRIPLSEVEWLSCAKPKKKATSICSFDSSGAEAHLRLSRQKSNHFPV
jgi:excisionase family DNA binding protein